jgi:hypothetical protein
MTMTESLPVSTVYAPSAEVQQVLDALPKRLRARLVETYNAHRQARAVLAAAERATLVANPDLGRLPDRVQQIRKDARDSEPQPLRDAAALALAEFGKARAAAQEHLLTAYRDIAGRAKTEADGWERAAWEMEEQAAASRAAVRDSQLRWSAAWNEIHAFS